MHLAIAYGNDEIAQEIVAVSNEKAINMLVSTVAKGKIWSFHFICKLQFSLHVIMVSVIIQQCYLFFSGVFFLPRDQQHDKPTKKTNYDGLAYLGGYALAWAACLGNETIYNILLEKV